MGMSRACAVLLGLLALTIAMPAGHAQEPFFAGKRLTVLVNFAPGGSTDTEARVFARHIGRLIDGQPSIVIQNMDGAGGLVGGKYVGEVGPRDGTLAGYFTGTGFLYALDPERFKVDFKSYEFVGIQPGTSINFVRSDVAPGMREPADIMKAKDLIIGSLARIPRRACACGSPLTFSACPINTSAAIVRAERPSLPLSAVRSISGESPPSYGRHHRARIGQNWAGDARLSGPRLRRSELLPADSAKGKQVQQFQTLYRALKGAEPSGQLWEVYKSVLAADGTLQRLIVMPPGVPAAAVAALREGLARLNKDKAHAEDAEKAFGYVPLWQIGTDNNAVAERSMTIRPEVRVFLLDYIKNPPK